MTMLSCFRMPSRVRIVGRTSSITNAFVNSIIPFIFPTEAEVSEALAILALNSNDLRCAYCGDRSTEWDHFRSVVRGKRPTGYISEIANLVPACGKCNQSKGAADWETWMRGSAPQSPARRGIADLEDRIDRLRLFEAWRVPNRLRFEEIIAPELLACHWKNNERLHALMYECQLTADEIYQRIEEWIAAQDASTQSFGTVPKPVKRISPRTVPRFSSEEGSDMEGTLQLLEVVALTVDLPEVDLRRGQVGTVVDVLGEERAFEVEFCDRDGRAYASLGLRPDQVMPLRYAPEAAASGSRE
jgi:Domain of unknown function (DUF4926)/HNH endonuclease